MVLSARLKQINLIYNNFPLIRVIGEEGSKKCGCNRLTLPERERKESRHKRKMEKQGPKWLPAILILLFLLRYGHHMAEDMHTHTQMATSTDENSFAQMLHERPMFHQLINLYAVDIPGLSKCSFTTVLSVCLCR